MFGRMILVAMVVGASTGLLFLFALVLLSPRKSCPVCSAPLPKLKLGRNAKMMLAREEKCKTCGSVFPIDSALKSKLQK